MARHAQKEECDRLHMENKIKQNDAKGLNN